MAKEKKRTVDLSGTILLALIPAFGYAMSYLYEFSYCKHFEIPRNVVVVSTTSILIAIFGITSALAVLLLIINGAIGIVDTRFVATPIRRAFARIGLILLFAVVVHLLYPIPNIGWMLLILILVFGFFEFVFPLITNHNVEGFSAKLEKQELTERNQPTVPEKVLGLFSERSKILIGLGLIMVFAASLRGSGVARTQSKFLVLIENPNFVVLRKYEDYFILGRIERSSKTVYKEFRFLEFKGGDAHKIPSFRWENVGPLKVEKQSGTEDSTLE